MSTSQQPPAPIHHMYDQGEDDRVTSPYARYGETEGGEERMQDQDVIDQEYATHDGQVEVEGDDEDDEEDDDTDHASTRHHLHRTSQSTLSKLHTSTHITPSLSTATTGTSLSHELLRLALSEYLRTQVIHVTLSVVLYGFNEHDYQAEDEIPMNQGKLCYLACTQSELVVIDHAAITKGISNLPVAPSYEQIAEMAPLGKYQMVLSVAYDDIENVEVDLDEADMVRIFLQDDDDEEENDQAASGKNASKANSTNSTAPPTTTTKSPLPSMLRLSTVHRAAFLQNLRALHDSYHIRSLMQYDSMFTPRSLFGAGKGGEKGGGKEEDIDPMEKQTRARDLLHPMNARDDDSTLIEYNTVSDYDTRRHLDGEQDSLLPPDDECHFSVITTNIMHVLPHVRQLKVAYIQADGEIIQPAGKNTVHAAEQFFDSIPREYEGRSMQHRGYLWCMPLMRGETIAMLEEEMKRKERGEESGSDEEDEDDEHEEGGNANTPPHRRWYPSPTSLSSQTATFFYTSRRELHRFNAASSSSSGTGPQGDVYDGRYFQVSVAKCRDVNPCSAILHSRDLRGVAKHNVVAGTTTASASAASGLDSSARAQGKYTMPSDQWCGLRDDGDDGSSSDGMQSELDTYFESVVRAVAMTEALRTCQPGSKPQYFILHSSTYVRRLNPTGDTSTWDMRVAHILTNRRELAVFVARRKYIPPYTEQIQDVVGVMYGECEPIPVRPKPAKQDKQKQSAPPQHDEEEEKQQQQHDENGDNTTNGTDNNTETDGTHAIMDGSNDTADTDGTINSPPAAAAPVIEDTPEEPLPPPPPAKLDALFFPTFLRILDTITPTVLPLPFQYTLSQSPSLMHPTYVDKFLLQARMNAFNVPSAQYYKYLSTRTWLSSEIGQQGMFPTTFYLGSRAMSLAAGFANAVLARVSQRKERLEWAERLPVVIDAGGGAGGGAGVAAGEILNVDTSLAAGPSSNQADEQKMDSELGESSYARERARPLDSSAFSGKQASVADPMDIVERFTTEFAVDQKEKEQEQSADGTQGQAAAAATAIDGIAAPTAKISLSSSSSLASPPPSSHTLKLPYSTITEWFGRVALFLTYVCDDGLFPGALTLRRIIDVVIGRKYIRDPATGQVEPLLIEIETAEKLEKCVEFMLFLKKRCGKPLDLPSYWTQRKASAQKKYLASNLSKISGNPIVVQALHPPSQDMHEKQTSVYAAMKSKAPAAFMSGGNGGGDAAGGMLGGLGGSNSSTSSSSDLDYNLNTSLLHKLRDVRLMSNFTCNERVMILLLDSGYIEYLEDSALNTEDHSDVSVLPALLTALLLKDYNTALIRAVCTKITDPQRPIEYDGFISPLVALIRDSSIPVTIYALKCLAWLSHSFPKVVFDYGGIHVCIWHILHNSDNEEILDFALSVLGECITSDTIHVFGEERLMKKLIEILQERCAQPGVRFRLGVLQKACTMILKFSQVPSLLSLLLSSHAHTHLLSLLRDPHYYSPILLHVTACIGQLYVNAGSAIMIKPTVETVEEDAVTLVHCLASFTHRSELRLCLNLLIILQYCLRLPKGYYSRLNNSKHDPATGKKAWTKPEKRFKERVEVLKKVVEDGELETHLDHIYSSAQVEDDRVTAELENSGVLQEDHSGHKIIKELVNRSPVDQQSDRALLDRRIVSKSCKEKIRWFRTRIKFAQNTGWNVNSIWQKDGNRQFLTIPKA